ncbi:MAG TPA: outer membrane lipoprotein carrier protein LolA [Prolixibacteraceae bacterium]|nr:outer membrane lipoprotein carrier protein LolA [Prolixibacteraceae bacterium]
MKKILILIISILTLVQTNAQVDQKAKSILDQVSEKTRKYNSISSDFDFTMENTEVDLKESNKGNLVLQNDKFVLKVSGIELISNGIDQWTYIEDANEVSISEANFDEEGMINPATIFTIYEEGFTYSFLGETNENGKKIYKIDLQPTEVKDFSRIVLNIDKDKLQISTATMFGTDGNKYTIAIKNMETSKKYPESFFTFDEKKHPGVTVIDMR